VGEENLADRSGVNLPHVCKTASGNFILKKSVRKLKRGKKFRKS